MDASRVYDRAWVLGCFYGHISTRTFRRALTASECVQVLQNENNSVKFQALVYDISSPATAIVVCEPVWPSGKPALYWANIRSLNILRTVR